MAEAALSTLDFHASRDAPQRTRRAPDTPRAPPHTPSCGSRPPDPSADRVPQYQRRNAVARTSNTR
eukprot:3390179-Prymnesium_polylepis.3